MPCLTHIRVVEHLDAKMVEPFRGVRILEEYELQGRLVDREVGVARPHLRGCGAEHLRIEVNRGAEVADVQRELQPHYDSPLAAG